MAAPIRRAMRQLSVDLNSFARGATALASLMALGACRPPASVATPRPLGAAVAVYRPVARDSALAPPPATSPGDSLTLQDVIRLTLLHSPELAAFHWQARASEARALDARRPPNPALEYIAEDFGVNAGPGAASTTTAVQRQTTIQLSQLVEIGGKRGLRGKVAARERDAADWAYEEARIDALTGATQAFVDVLAAQQMAALAARTDALVAQVSQSVAARVVAGDVSPIEEMRAQAARATARVDRGRAERALVTARERLATFWGATRATFAGIRGDFPGLRELPSLDVLHERLRENPELARWASRTAARRAALSLEQMRRIPDLQLVGGYRRFDDLNVSAYVIGASIPLPIFNQNINAVAEARSLANKAAADERTAQVRVATALSGAYGALTGAQAEVAALRDSILPRIREAFELITEGYRLGRFGYLDVLDAQRTLIASEERYLRAQSDYHKSVADVERLIGAPLGNATSR